MNATFSSIEPLEARIAPATILVTTFKDITSAAHDTGSLRDAIFLANASVGVPDEIIFQKTDGKALKGAIPLGSDLPAITDSLTITGSVVGKATGISINGNKHAIFQITDGDVTLKDLTIKNGLAQKGGGILINDAGGTITLTGLAITGNRAISATNALGGGIAIIEGTVNISTSKITGNFATGLDGIVGASAGGSALGGGIYSEGKLTLTDSLVAGNTAKGGKARALSGAGGGDAIGGGIVASKDTADVTVIGSLIAKNKVIGGNGAAAAAKSALEGGDGGAANGAGIANESGILSITNSLVIGNSGKGGAGGKGGSGDEFDDGGDGGRGGVANGGGVASYSTDAEVTVRASTIAGNSATGGKGGAGGAAGAGGGTFSGFSRGFAVSTGGGLSSDAIVDISQSFITGNSTRFGGGIGLDPGAEITIDASTITKNKGTSSGGGVDMYGTTLLITNSTIAQNTAPYGAGIQIAEGSLQLYNSTVAQNTAKTDGGGIYSATLDLVEIISTIIAGNKAKTDADFFYDDINGGNGAQVSFSLIQNVTDGTILDGVSHANLENVDPKLLKLGNNGGPTLTYLLAADSPAINQGSNPDALTTDQRGTGFIRTKGAATDIGATEIA